MPFEQLGDQPLVAVVNVRMTVAEKERLKEEAHVAGLTVSALARRRIFGRSVVAGVDLAMIRELRRLGGLAKAVYLEDKSLARHTADVLKEIKSFIANLSRGQSDAEIGLRYRKIKPWQR
jgi:hypothetical protein